MVTSEPMDQTATLTQHALGTPIDAPGPVLMVLYGPDPRRIGDRLTLSAGETLQFGRSTVVGQRPLGDARVSSKHARLRVAADGESVKVEDQGSKNGSFCHGDRIDSTTLEDGDTVQLGGSFFQFVVEPTFRGAAPDTLLGGVSWTAHRLRQSVAATGAHSLPVVVIGPTGAGKELVAREVHRVSGLAGSFVPLNCATLSPQLAESELFGHERGAFTGADRAKMGLFQRASGGTLFLDEIATLPTDLQPKLLRALQEGKVRPVGGSREEPCVTRIVAATNEDLAALVNAGAFRADLYARLIGSLVEVPGLSERRGDLGWLAHHLLERSGKSTRLAPDLIWALLAAPWPLNVRGLEQLLLGAAGEAVDGVLGLTDGVTAALAAQARLTGTSTVEDSPAPVARKRAQKPEKTVFETLLQTHAGNIGAVASALGVRRQQVYRWLDFYELDISSYR